VNNRCELPHERWVLAHFRYCWRSPKRGEIGAKCDHRPALLLRPYVDLTTSPAVSLSVVRFHPSCRTRLAKCSIDALATGQRTCTTNLRGAALEIASACFSEIEPEPRDDTLSRFLPHQYCHPTRIHCYATGGRVSASYSVMASLTHMCCGHGERQHLLPVIHCGASRDFRRNQAISRPFPCSMC